MVKKLMVCLFLIALLSSSTPVRATDVLDGHDLWQTQPGGAHIDIGFDTKGDPDDDLPALPADFFGPAGGFQALEVDPGSGNLQFFRNAIAHLAGHSAYAFRTLRA